MRKVHLIVGCLFVFFYSDSLFAQTVVAAGKGNPTNVAVTVNGNKGTIRTVEVSCDNSNDKDCYKVEIVQGIEGTALELGYKSPITNLPEKIRMKRILDFQSYRHMGGVTDVIRYIADVER